MIYRVFYGFIDTMSHSLSSRENKLEYGTKIINTNSYGTIEGIVGNRIYIHGLDEATVIVIVSPSRSWIARYTPNVVVDNEKNCFSSFLDSIATFRI